MKCNVCGTIVNNELTNCPTCGNEIKKKNGAKPFVIGAASAGAATLSYKGIEKLFNNNSNISSELKDLSTNIEQIETAPNESETMDNSINDTIAASLDNEISIDPTEDDDVNYNDSLIIDEKSKSTSNKKNNSNSNNSDNSYDEIIINNEKNSIDTKDNTVSKNDSDNIENVEISIDDNTISDTECICTHKCSNTDINQTCPICQKNYNKCQSNEEEKNNYSTSANDANSDSSEYINDSDDAGSAGGGGGGSASGGGGDSVGISDACLEMLCQAMGCGATSGTPMIDSIDDCQSEDGSVKFSNFNTKFKNLCSEVDSYTQSTYNFTGSNVNYSGGNTSAKDTKKSNDSCSVPKTSENTEKIISDAASAKNEYYRMRTNLINTRNNVIKTENSDGKSFSDNVNVEIGYYMSNNSEIIDYMIKDGFGFTREYVNGSVVYKSEDDSGNMFQYIEGKGYVQVQYDEATNTFTEVYQNDNSSNISMRSYFTGNFSSLSDADIIFRSLENYSKDNHSAIDKNSEEAKTSSFLDFIDISDKGFFTAGILYGLMGNTGLNSNGEQQSMISGDRNFGDSGKTVIDYCENTVNQGFYNKDDTINYDEKSDIQKDTENKRIEYDTKNSIINNTGSTKYMDDCIIYCESDQADKDHAYNLIKTGAITTATYASTTGKLFDWDNDGEISEAERNAARSLDEATILKWAQEEKEKNPDIDLNDINSLRDLYNENHKDNSQLISANGTYNEEEFTNAHNSGILLDNTQMAFINGFIDYIPGDKDLKLSEKMFNTDITLECIQKDTDMIDFMILMNQNDANIELAYQMKEYSQYITTDENGNLIFKEDSITENDINNGYLLLADALVNSDRIGRYSDEYYSYIKNYIPIINYDINNGNILDNAAVNHFLGYIDLINNTYNDYLAAGENRIPAYFDYETGNYTCDGNYYIDAYDTYNNNSESIDKINNMINNYNEALKDYYIKCCEKEGIEPDLENFQGFTYPSGNDVALIAIELNNARDKNLYNLANAAYCYKVSYLSEYGYENLSYDSKRELNNLFRNVEIILPTDATSLLDFLGSINIADPRTVAYIGTGKLEDLFNRNIEAYVKALTILCNDDESTARAIMQYVINLVGYDTISYKKAGFDFNSCNNIFGLSEEIDLSWLNKYKVDSDDIDNPSVVLKAILNYGNVKLDSDSRNVILSFVERFLYKSTALSSYKANYDNLLVGYEFYTNENSKNLLVNDNKAIALFSKNAANIANIVNNYNISVYQKDKQAIPQLIGLGAGEGEIYKELTSEELAKIEQLNNQIEKCGEISSSIQYLSTYSDQLFMSIISYLDDSTVEELVNKFDKEYTFKKVGVSNSRKEEIYNSTYDEDEIQYLLCDKDGNVISSDDTGAVIYLLLAYSGYIDVDKEILNNIYDNNIGKSFKSYSALIDDSGYSELDIIKAYLLGNEQDLSRYSIFSDTLFEKGNEILAYRQLEDYKDKLIENDKIKTGNGKVYINKDGYLSDKDGNTYYVNIDGKSCQVSFSDKISIDEDGYLIDEDGNRIYNQNVEDILIGKGISLEYNKGVAWDTVSTFFNSVLLGLNTFEEGFYNLFNADGLKSASDYYNSVLSNYFVNEYGNGGSALNIAFTGGVNIGNMLPSIIASAVVSVFTGGLGTPVLLAKALNWMTMFSTMGLSVMGNSREEALQLGMSQDQAWAYGLINGISETTLESILGKMYGGTGLENLAHTSSKVFNWFIESFAGEAIEEGAQEWISDGLKSILTSGDIVFNASETAQNSAVSALWGGVMGLFFGGVGAVVNAPMAITSYLKTGNSQTLNVLLNRINSNSPWLLNLNTNIDLFFDLVSRISKSDYNSTYEMLLNDEVNRYTYDNLSDSVKNEYGSYKEYCKQQALQNVIDSAVENAIKEQGINNINSRLTDLSKLKEQLEQQRLDAENNHDLKESIEEVKNEIKQIEENINSLSEEEAQVWKETKAKKEAQLKELLEKYNVLNLDNQLGDIDTELKALEKLKECFENGIFSEESLNSLTSSDKEALINLFNDALMIENLAYQLNIDLSEISDETFIKIIKSSNETDLVRIFGDKISERYNAITDSKLSSSIKSKIKEINKIIEENNKEILEAQERAKERINKNKESAIVNIDESIENLNRRIGDVKSKIKANQKNSKKINKLQKELETLISNQETLNALKEKLTKDSFNINEYSVDELNILVKYSGNDFINNFSNEIISRLSELNDESLGNLINNLSDETLKEYASAIIAASKNVKSSDIKSSIGSKIGSLENYLEEQKIIEVEQNLQRSEERRKILKEQEELIQEYERVTNEKNEILKRILENNEKLLNNSDDSVLVKRINKENANLSKQLNNINNSINTLESKMKNNLLLLSISQTKLSSQIESLKNRQLELENKINDMKSKLKDTTDSVEQTELLNTIKYNEGILNILKNEVKVDSITEHYYRHGIENINDTLNNHNKTEYQSRVETLRNVLESYALYSFTASGTTTLTILGLKENIINEIKLKQQQLSTLDKVYDENTTNEELKKQFDIDKENLEKDIKKKQKLLVDLMDVMTKYKLSPNSPLNSLMDSLKNDVNDSKLSETVKEEMIADARDNISKIKENIETLKLKIKNDENVSNKLSERSKKSLLTQLNALSEQILAIESSNDTKVLLILNESIDTIYKSLETTILNETALDAYNLLNRGYIETSGLIVNEDFVNGLKGILSDDLIAQLETYTSEVLTEETLKEVRELISNQFYIVHENGVIEINQEILGRITETSGETLQKLRSQLEGIIRSKKNSSLTQSEIEYIDGIIEKAFIKEGTITDTIEIIETVEETETLKTKVQEKLSELQRQFNNNIIILSVDIQTKLELLKSNIEKAKSLAEYKKYSLELNNIEAEISKTIKINLKEKLTDFGNRLKATADAVSEDIKLRYNELLSKLENNLTDLESINNEFEILDADFKVIEDSKAKTALKEKLTDFGNRLKATADAVSEDIKLRYNELLSKLANNLTDLESINNEFEILDADFEAIVDNVNENTKNKHFNRAVNKLKERLLSFKEEISLDSDVSEDIIARYNELVNQINTINSYDSIIEINEKLNALKEIFRMIDYVRSESIDSSFSQLGFSHNSTYGADQGIIYNLCTFEYKGKKYSYRQAKSMVNNAINEGRAIPKFRKKGNREYFNIKYGIMSKYGLSENDASIIMLCIDDAGACSYASICNEIFASFLGHPKKFQQIFGYSMYRNVDGKRSLNTPKLLTDLYLYVNLSENGGNLLYRNSNGTYSLNKNAISNEVDPLGRPILDSGKYQKYLSTNYGKNADIINKFLNSKGLNYQSTLLHQYNNSTYSYDNIVSRVSEGMKNGKVYSLEIFYGKNEIIMHSMNPNMYGDMSTHTWSEDDGHSIFITDVNSNGFVVSSWGHKYLITYQDVFTSGLAVLTENVITKGTTITNTVTNTANGLINRTNQVVASNLSANVGHSELLSVESEKIENILNSINESSEVNGQKLKSEILSTIEGMNDPIAIIKKLYFELNKRVHYSREYSRLVNIKNLINNNKIESEYSNLSYTERQELLKTVENQLSDIYFDKIDFDNLKDRNIICKSWSSLFAELLNDIPVLNDANVEIIGSDELDNHQFIKITINDSIILADAAISLCENCDIDIINTKYNTEAKSFLVYTKPQFGEILNKYNYFSHISNGIVRDLFTNNLFGFDDYYKLGIDNANSINIDLNNPENVVISKMRELFLKVSPTLKEKTIRILEETIVNNSKTMNFGEIKRYLNFMQNQGKISNLIFDMKYDENYGIIEFNDSKYIFTENNGLVKVSSEELELFQSKILEENIIKNSKNMSISEIKDYLSSLETDGKIKELSFTINSKEKSGIIEYNNNYYIFEEGNGLIKSSEEEIQLYKNKLFNAKNMSIQELADFIKSKVEVSKEIDILDDNLQKVDTKTNDVSISEASKINGQQLLSEILSTIEGLTDKTEIAKKLYVELNKRVHYSNEYLHTNDENIESKIYYENVSFDTLTDKNIICRGWTSLYIELLEKSGVFNDDFISNVGKDNNGNHHFALIALGDTNTVIIADATDGISNTTDIINCKLGKPTVGFLVYSIDEYNSFVAKYGNRPVRILEKSIETYNNGSIEGNKINDNIGLIDESSIIQRAKDLFESELDSSTKYIEPIISNNLKNMDLTEARRYLDYLYAKNIISKYYCHMNYEEKYGIVEFNNKSYIYCEGIGLRETSIEEIRQFEGIMDETKVKLEDTAEIIVIDDLNTNNKSENINYPTAPIELFEDHLNDTIVETLDKVVESLNVSGNAIDILKEYVKTNDLQLITRDNFSRYYISMIKINAIVEYLNTKA